MPVISLFFGIIIRMYFDDHPPPHFHAEYQGFKAVFEISNGKVRHGKLPNKAEKLVKQWALDHKSELMANWQRGVGLMPMELIPGADLDD